MMKFRPLGLLLITVLGFLQVSCINDGLSESYSDGQGILKPLSVQVDAMKASAGEIASVLVDHEDERLAEVASLIDGHVSEVESGLSLEEAALSAMEIQKKLAQAVAAVSDEDLKEKLASLEKGVCAWIGNDFTYVYPLVLKSEELCQAAQGLAEVSAGLSGILSDVESGLKEGVSLDELKKLSESVDAEVERASESGASVGSLLEEVQSGYVKSIRSICSGEDFDGSALKKVNESAASVLAQVEATYSDLVERIS